jgi:hypothetical protein
MAEPDRTFMHHPARDAATPPEGEGFFQAHADLIHPFAWLSLAGDLENERRTEAKQAPDITRAEARFGDIQVRPAREHWK